MDIDTWTAEQCGTEVDDGYFEYEAQDGWAQYIDKWDYKNPRCREIIREHFKIETYCESKWYAVSKRAEFTGVGKTIPEAEIACIEAIYATEDRYK